MTIDKSRSQPATLQVPFLVSPVALPRSAYADDAAIGYCDISRVTFAAAHVNEPGIAKH